MSPVLIKFLTVLCIARGVPRGKRGVLGLRKSRLGEGSAGHSKRVLIKLAVFTFSGSLSMQFTTVKWMPSTVARTHPKGPVRGDSIARLSCRASSPSFLGDMLQRLGVSTTAEIIRGTTSWEVERSLYLERLLNHFPPSEIRSSSCCWTFKTLSN